MSDPYPDNEQETIMHTLQWDLPPTTVGQPIPHDLALPISQPVWSDHGEHCRCPEHR